MAFLRQEIGACQFSYLQRLIQLYNVHGFAEMERIGSDEEDEEEEVVIHLTSANPQVNKGNLEYESEGKDDFAVVGEPSSVCCLVGCLFVCLFDGLDNLEDKNDFAGVGEPSSEMGLGHQILCSSLFSKWVKR